MDGLLTLFLLQLIEAEQCLSRRYVAVALRNEYIRITKKFLVIMKREKEYFEFCVTEPDEVNHAELKMLVSDVLKTLTNEQRKVVKLRFWDGLSCDEIARRKGISRQAVSRTQKRALDNLKSLL